MYGTVVDHWLRPSSARGLPVRAADRMIELGPMA